MAIEAQHRAFILFIAICICTSSFTQTIGDLRPTVTMKEYVDMQAELNKEWTQKFIDVQIQNINDNVGRANAAMEKRLDGINEFRGQLKDQAGTFITRAELFAWCTSLIFFFFAFSKWQKDKVDSSGKNIVSGDKVEVKK